ncbi:MAG: hypothetical protein ABIK09_02650 [Pseudomonadota bacterium]
MGLRTILVISIALLATACAHAPRYSGEPANRQEAFLLEHLPSPAPTRDDEAWARSAKAFLARAAGRGLEGTVDISAACGCVDSGDGGGSGGGPGGPVGPDIEGPSKEATIRVKVVLPDPS